MASESSRNPYESPKSVAVPGQAGLREPGPLAVVVIAVVSVVAACCIFLCTCFGIGLVGFEVLGGLSEGLIILLAVVGGGAAAFFLGSILSRTLTGFVVRHSSASRSASIDERPQQDDHIS